MRLRFPLLLAAVVCALLPAQSNAQLVRGTITDNDGQTVPYATVAIVGTTQGVVASPEGVYSLQLPAAGSYQLQIRSLGYQPRFEQVQLADGQTLQLDIRLSGEELVLSDVMITSDGRDPAYAIIAEAIKRRRTNDNSVRAYSAKSYTRTTAYNRKTKKIEYLSEAFSTLYVRKPNDRKEVIHNERISGDSRGYSGVGALFTVINPYKNLIGFPQLFVREFVSPLADNAFFFYNYKYLGSYREKGFTIYKIQFWPKRASDPAFTGSVYLVDGSYAIKSLDASAYGNQPIRYFDTLRARQEFLPVRDSLWLPFNNNMYGAIKINALVQSFNFTGQMVNVFSDYVISDPAPGRTLSAAERARLVPPKTATAAPVQASKRKRADPPPANAQPATPAPVAGDSVQQALAKLEREEALTPTLSQRERERGGVKDTFFDELLRVEKKVTANNRNLAFWDSIRPIALTDSERVNFTKGDSLERRRSSKEFRDSLNRATNKFEWGDIFTGYTYRNVANNNTFSVESPFQAVQFNTMEGWNITLGLRKTFNRNIDSLNLEQADRLSLGADLRYGVARERLAWRVSANYTFDRTNYRSLRVSFEDYVAEFSGQMEQISPLVNTIYTLFQERNYLKLQRQIGTRWFYGQRIGKNNILNFNAFAFRRSELPNLTQFVVSPQDNREYTPNIPLPTHYSAYGEVVYGLRFGSRYITMPTGKFYISNPQYPQLSFSAGYGTQWRDGGGEQVSYQTIRARASGELDFKLLGEFSYLLRGGWMFRDGDVLLPDQFHVRANRVLLRADELDRFGLMDYYSYASQRGVGEVHVEHNFRGFWLNKLPLLRKLKWHEIVGFHGAAMPQLVPHTELLVGLSNIRIAKIDLFRVNWHTVLTGPLAGRAAITFTVGVNL